MKPSQSIVKPQRIAFVTRLREFLTLSPVDFSSFRPLRLQKVEEIAEVLAHQDLAFASKRKVDIELSDPLVFRKSVELPRAARKKSLRILKLQAEAFGKSSKSDVVHKSIRQQTNGNADTYHMFYVMKEDLDRIAKTATDYGVVIRSIVFRYNNKTVYFSDNRAAHRWFSTACWVLSLVAVNAVLGDHFINGRSQQSLFRSQIVAIENETKRLSASLGSQQRARTETSELQSKVQAQLDRLARGLTAGPTLVEVTKTLPLDAWLSRLVLVNDELYISGRTSGNPIEMIERFEAQPWVKYVSVEGPLQRDDSVSETIFDLKIDIARDAL